MTDWIGIIKSLGVPVAILIYLFWADFNRRREDKNERETLSKRLTSVEDYQRNKLEGLISKNGVESQRTADVLTRLTIALENRPCLTGTQV